mgnify:CR=1 FL=1
MYEGFADNSIGAFFSFRGKDLALIINDDGNYFVSEVSSPNYEIGDYCDADLISLDDLDDSTRAMAELVISKMGAYHD